MNQILVTNVDNNSQSNDIKPIIRFFCIVCIIFALILISEGGYNLYKSMSKNEKATTDNRQYTEAEGVTYGKPELRMEKNGSAVNLIINAQVGINKVIYSWNNGKVTTVNAEGKKDFNFEIEIPPGENSLSVSTVDVNGTTTKFKNQTVSFTSAEDTTKPKISMENVDGKLKITVTDDSELDYLSYQWEGSEEVIIKPSEDNKSTIVQELEVQKGTTNLTLVAVDIHGNKETTNRSILGSNGPTVKASLSDGNFVINVTAEFGITKILYSHSDKEVTNEDEEFTVEGIPEGAKEFEFKVPLKDGPNFLRIKAYENGIMTEFKCKKTK